MFVISRIITLTLTLEKSFIILGYKQTAYIIFLMYFFWQIIFIDSHYYIIWKIQLFILSARTLMLGSFSNPSWCRFSHWRLGMFTSLRFPVILTRIPEIWGWQVGHRSCRRFTSSFCSTYFNITKWKTYLTPKASLWLTSFGFGFMLGSLPTWSLLIAAVARLSDLNYVQIFNGMFLMTFLRAGCLYCTLHKVQDVLCVRSDW